MAAVLAAGEGAALSHDSAAELWGFRPKQRGPVEVTAPTRRRKPGVLVHRAARFDVTRRRHIPVTTVVQTLVDLSPRLPRNRLERAINEADILGLIDPDRLRGALKQRGREAARLRETLDRRTFRLTRSELERLLIPIALRAGLPIPQTRAIVNGFEVDFWWPELGLVVESDGLKYHRTPAEQAADRLRDQIHTAAGLTTLRFTHWQVKHDAAHVERTLRAVHRRLTRMSDLPELASGGGAANAAR